MNMLFYMKRKYYLLLTLLPAVLSAQTSDKDSLLNRTVVVEQEYNPEIMDASKINNLPEVEVPSVPKQAIEYSLQPHPVSSFHVYQPLTTFTLKEAPKNYYPGYIRLGYGNRNNLDGAIGYAFQLSSKDELTISGAIRGMKGKIKFPHIGKQKQHDYRSQAGIDYRHLFPQTEMRLYGNWQLHNLSLHPQFILNNQRFTAGNAHWSLTSSNPTSPIQFIAEADWKMHQRAHNWTNWINKESKATEHQMQVHALMSGVINDFQHIGLDLKMHQFIYATDFSSNYTALHLNPFYEIENNGWKLHAGIHVDPSFGLGKKLQLSPDIELNFSFANHYQLYVKAKGGRNFNDFNHLAAFCPYANLSNQLKNTYEPINASIGFKTSPYDGLHLHLFGGYQNLKDDLYTYWKEENSEIAFKQAHSENFYGGLNIRYGYKDIFIWNFQGSYLHWDACSDALFFKPQIHLSTTADLHFVKPLYLHIGYDYQKPQSESPYTIVHNLTAGVSYNLVKGLSAYINMNNLLNKRYTLHWNYPNQGLQIIGGLSYKF